MNTDELIQQIVETIRDGYQPEKIILFGSRVWGEPDEESDLDVLVIKESEKHEVDRIREVSRLVERFQRRPYLLALDILVKTPRELQGRLAVGDDFIREIVARGRVAYDQSGGWGRGDGSRRALPCGIGSQSLSVPLDARDDLCQECREAGPGRQR